MHVRPGPRRVAAVVLVQAEQGVIGMAEHTAADGTTYTDEDIERWGQEAEAGFPDWKFGTSVTGRPRDVEEENR